MNILYTRLIFIYVYSQKRAIGTSQTGTQPDGHPVFEWIVNHSCSASVLPNMPCTQRTYRVIKASAHGSAAGNEERPSS